VAGAGVAAAGSVAVEEAGRTAPDRPDRATRRLPGDRRREREGLQQESGSDGRHLDGVTQREPNPLFLRTLGGASLAIASGAPLLGRGKTLALVLYLALTPGRRASREFLLDLLWADLDPERGRRALRQALFQARRHLGEESIRGNEELELHLSLQIDRDQFFSAIERGDLARALDLYEGPFLPSYGIPGGAAFEHWADSERDRTQRAFLRSAELVVRRQLNEARFREARRLSDRVRDLAPNEESSYRLVLEAAIVARDFITASVEADGLERWAIERDMPLEPASRALIAQARQMPPNPATQDAAGLVAELTGREREFAAIIDAWNAVRMGAPKQIHLTSPAGFGKTRLLHDVVTRLAMAGVPVVRLSANHGDREIPFAFAADLAAALLTLPGASGLAPDSASTLVALNPSLSGKLRVQPDLAQGEEALRRRMHALTDLVQASAHERPFVIALDDLHWIDLASYRLLDGLATRLASGRVLCLTAARPECPALGPAPVILPLPPLTVEQVGSLVSALGIIPDEPPWATEFTSRLFEATNGSPLLVLETLRLCLDREILGLEQGEWRCLNEQRLQSVLRVGEALRERVRGLPDREAWLLAVLAAAGLPMEMRALAMVGQGDADEWLEVLSSLERQGLVRHGSGGWSPAHDEIAAAASAGLDSETRNRANRAIGTTLLADGMLDASRLIRAARHFALAGEPDQVKTLFRRYAVMARRRKDRRGFEELATEFVGATSGGSGAALSRSLPWSVRLGLWSPLRRAAAAAAIVFGGSSLVLASYFRSADSGAEQRLVYLDSLRQPTLMVVHGDDLDGRNVPLDPIPGRTAMTSAALGHPELPPAISPDGRSVAWAQDSGDSTTLDIWIRTPVGTRRLTSQARDDLVMEWLPDGSGLLGLTNRWSPRETGNYDVAVFDTATGLARPITDGPAHDGHPHLSPDGTRVAFIRESDDAPPQLCLTTIDGLSDPECRIVSGRPIARLIGWTGQMELTIVLDAGIRRPLVRYDWLRNVTTEIQGPYVYEAQLSPDRRFVVASIRLEGIRGIRDWIVPLSDPAKARPVREPGERSPEIKWWEGNADHSALIDRMEFTDSIRELMPGVGTRLRVRPLTASGEEVPVRARIRWSSSDTSVAVVDSTGEVRVRSRGDVIVTASLGGWRSVSHPFHVSGVEPRTVLVEQWDATWRDRWITWGDPSPQVVTGPGGVRGFWNRGDGTYQSMGILRHAYSARQGLGVEVRISTRLDRFKWQRLRIALVAGLDTSAYQHADQQKAPPGLGRSDAHCGFGFPGDGSYGASRVSFFAGLAEIIDLGPVADTLRRGGWWTVRLQILPDGRCGLAINGRVIRISPEPVVLDGAYRVRLGDESAGTRLLHGPLQIWTGVRADVNWSTGPSGPG
jgi:DNA-binding SARP family transcriptional activator